MSHVCAMGGCFQHPVALCITDAPPPLPIMTNSYEDQARHRQPLFIMTFKPKTAKNVAMPSHYYCYYYYYVDALVDSGTPFRWF